MPKSGQFQIDSAPFRIGVNYWPLRTGPDFLQRFDIDEVHEDFATLSDLGINFARVSLNWEYFQPDPDNLRCSALAHLLELCDAAASERVKLELVLFSAPLGVSDPFPAWLSRELGETADRCPQGFIRALSNPIAQCAATKLVRSIARSVGSHQAIWAYNLGDCTLSAAPRSCQSAARTWFDRLSTELHAEDNRHPVTCNFTGSLLLSSDALRLDQVSSAFDHSTIDYQGIAGDIHAPESERVAAFSCALTAALSGKPCLVEAGNRTDRNASPQPIETDGTPLDSLLDALHRVGALGALIGSYVDPPAQCQDTRTSIRRGLFGPLGEERPHTRLIRDFARSKPQVLKSPQHALKLDVSADEYYAHPSAHATRLFQGFLSRH